MGEKGFKKMDRKVRKVIKKLIQYGNKELLQFEEELLQNKFNQSKLAQAVILLHFQQLNFDGVIEEDDKHEVDIHFLEPAKIFNALDTIIANIANFKDVVLFLEWYLKRFVSFYMAKSLKRYEAMGNALVYKINSYLGVSPSEKKVIYNIMLKSNMQEKSYAFYKTISEKMSILYQSGILYTQQYDLLFQLGMSKDFIKLVKKYQVSSLLNNVNENTIKIKNDSKANNANEDTPKKENDSKANNANEGPTSLENTQSVSKPSLSHRNIKGKLDKYLNLSTLQNKMLIEGDTFKKVDLLLKQLYPESITISIEKKIIANNEAMKQEAYRQITQELLPDGEDVQLFAKAKEFLRDTTRDAMFSPYLNLVQKIVSDIDTYLLSYLVLSIEERKLWKDDYIGLICLSLEDLKLHLDFLPFDGSFLR